MVVELLYLFLFVLGIFAGDSERKRLRRIERRFGRFLLLPRILNFPRCRAITSSGAFATADRFRARTLREEIGITAPAPHSPVQLQRALPAETAILEYAFVPAGLMIFCLTPDSLTATPVAVDRTSLRILIGQFRAAMEQRAEPAAERGADRCDAGR